MTLQVELFTIISRLARQVVSLTSTVEELSNTVKNLSNNARDLSTTVAASTAKITPQINIAQRQPPKSYAEAAATPGGQQPPTTPVNKGKKRSGTIGPTPLAPKNPKTKQNKDSDGKSPGPGGATADQSMDDPILQPKSLNIAKRRIYSTRRTPTPLSEALSLEPKISIAITKELRKCGCSAPTNLQIQVNPTTGTVSLTTPPTVESSEYINYLAPMTAALKSLVPEALRDYTEFRQAPTETQVIIHGIAVAPTNNDAETLSSIIKESLSIGYQITASSVRFLQKNPEVRREKRYTSIVVSVPSDDVEQIVPNVLVHGRWKKAAVVWNANPTKQCTKCYPYGHPEQGCKADKHTCPICAGKHRLKDHKCSSPTCPSKGDRKVIADCCPVTPSKCIACGGNHPAFHAECPVKVKAKADAKAHFDRRRGSRPSDARDTSKE